MSGTIKAKAYESALRCIPLQKQSAVRDPLRMKDFMAGYMAGHAAHTRWSNKREFERRAERYMLADSYAPQTKGEQS